ncbi:MAG: helix-turn-helix transcriptional regulator [Pseudomonadota bacterium]
MADTSNAPEALFRDDIATFGDRLEAARQAKGLSIDSFAEKLGIGADVVEAWENNMKLPRANRMQMMSGLLNVSLVWLLNGDDNGTFHVADNYDRSEGVNDTLGELAQMRSTLQHVLDRIDALEERLLDLD